MHIHSSLRRFLGIDFNAAFTIFLCVADPGALGVEKIGAVTVDCRTSDTKTSAKKREISVAVYFGSSEIQATAEFVMTKNKTSAKMTYGKGELMG